MNEQVKQPAVVEPDNNNLPSNQPDRRDIELSDDGLMNVKKFSELLRVSNMLVKSGILPKHYDTPEKVTTAILMVKELGLKPINALKSLAVINGVPTLHTDLPLAMVRNSGTLEMINEFLIDKDYKKICFENKNLEAEVFAAICEVQRKGFEKKTSHYTKMNRDKNPNSKNAVWSANNEIMMKRKARAIALKDEFGDVLGGLKIAEYDYDVIPRAGESLQISHSNVHVEDKNLNDELNEKFKAKE